MLSWQKYIFEATRQHSNLDQDQIIRIFERQWGEGKRNLFQVQAQINSKEHYLTGSAEAGPSATWVFRQLKKLKAGERKFPLWRPSGNWQQGFLTSIQIDWPNISKACWLRNQGIQVWECKIGTDGYAENALGAQNLRCRLAGVQNSFRCLSAENLCLAKRVNCDISAKMRQSA